MEDVPFCPKTDKEVNVLLESHTITRSLDKHQGNSLDTTTVGGIWNFTLIFLLL